MNEIICILSFIAFVFANETIKSDLYEIGANHERIRKVFRECSTLSVLLRNYEQPEGVINWLDEIFGTGNMSFAVFNIANGSDHESFLEQCVNFQGNSSIRTAYHERAFRKTYSNYGDMKGFDVFENELNLVVSETAFTFEKSRENFAEILDKWRFFRHEGFILFTTLENLEIYLGCLGSRHGTFLFIIVTTINDKNYMKTVEKFFVSAWKMFGNFKVFILINRQILTYSPFNRVFNDAFGEIKVFEHLFTDDDLRQINGHPLNVEIFYSAYSVGNEKTNNFRGPDVDATYMIAARLNSTSKYFYNVLRIYSIMKKI